VSVFLSSGNICGAHSLQAGYVSALHHVLTFHPTETYPSYWCHVSGSEMHPRSVIPGKMLKNLVVVEVIKSCRFFLLRVSSATLSTLFGIALLPADWRDWIITTYTSVEECKSYQFYTKAQKVTSNVLEAAVATFSFTILYLFRYLRNCKSPEGADAESTSFNIQWRQKMATSCNPLFSAFLSLAVLQTSRSLWCKHHEMVYCPERGL